MRNRKHPRNSQGISVRKPFRAFVAAIYYFKAKEKLNSGALDGAFHYVKKFKKTLCAETIFILLIEGNIYFRMRKYNSSLVVMEKALKKLESDSDLGFDDRKYLSAHAAYIINFSIVQGKLPEKMRKIDLDFDLGNVKSIYKNQYTVLTGDD